MLPALRCWSAVLPTSPDPTLKKEKDIKMRPKYDLRANCNPNEFLLAVQERLESDGSDVTGKVFPSSAVLKMIPEKVHFWSPQIQLSIEPFLPSGSVVHVLIGPRPSVWSLFVASYCFFSFIGVMGMVFSYSQVSLGQEGTALWSAPFSLLGFMVTYGFARLGRKLAGKQSDLLFETVEQIIEDCAD
jgi:hypothetical protein